MLTFTPHNVQHATWMMMVTMVMEVTFQMTHGDNQPHTLHTSQPLPISLITQLGWIHGQAHLHTMITLATIMIVSIVMREEKEGKEPEKKQRGGKKFIFIFIFILFVYGNIY